MQYRGDQFQRAQIENQAKQIDFVANQAKIADADQVQQPVDPEPAHELALRGKHEGQHRYGRQADFDPQKWFDTERQQVVHEQIDFDGADIQQVQRKQRIGTTQQDDPQCDVQQMRFMPVEDEMMIIGGTAAVASARPEITVHKGMDRFLATPILSPTSICK
jgi:hypothetical protein